MPVLVFDRIESTADPKYAAKKLPPALAKLFASKGLTIPATGEIAIWKIDDALAGIDPVKRIEIKAQLRECGVKLIVG